MRTRGGDFKPTSIAPTIPPIPKDVEPESIFSPKARSREQSEVSDAAWQSKSQFLASQPAEKEPERIPAAWVQQLAEREQVLADEPVPMEVDDSNLIPKIPELNDSPEKEVIEECIMNDAGELNTYFEPTREYLSEEKHAESTRVYQSLIELFPTLVQSSIVAWVNNTKGIEGHAELVDVMSAEQYALFTHMDEVHNLVMLSFDAKYKTEEEIAQMMVEAEANEPTDGVSQAVTLTPAVVLTPAVPAVVLTPCLSDQLRDRAHPMQTSGIRLEESLHVVGPLNYDIMSQAISYPDTAVSDSYCNVSSAAQGSEVSHMTDSVWFKLSTRQQAKARIAYPHGTFRPH
jgi:hypothetical protein